MLSASLRAARLAGAPREVEWEIVAEVAALLTRELRGRPPIAVSPAAQAIVRRLTGVADPFEGAKREANHLLSRLAPRIREAARSSRDPLAYLLGAAAAGNAVDLGARDGYRAEELLAHPDWGRFDYREFLAALSRAGDVLIIADNAGEIVFDKLLSEELSRRGKRVTVAVRGAPTLNDATHEDAEEIGLAEVAEVITTGADHPGVLLERASPEFVRRFREAELVIAKGMGNYEGLSEERGPLFFLLKAKCAPIAGELGVKQGQLVLARAAGLPGGRQKGQG
jgi:uncharacterized protein with ATP-grasp and redox domains